jgi:hypothetical protein
MGVLLRAHTAGSRNRPPKVTQKLIALGLSAGSELTHQSGVNLTPIHYENEAAVTCARCCPSRFEFGLCVLVCCE